MAKCPNCSKTLSCGCQNRKASNGKAVCSNCLTNYENTLKSQSNPTSSVVKDKSLREASGHINLEKFM